MEPDLGLNGDVISLIDKGRSMHDRRASLGGEGEGLWRGHSEQRPE